MYFDQYSLFPLFVLNYVHFYLKESENHFVYSFFFVFTFQPNLLLLHRANLLVHYAFFFSLVYNTIMLAISYFIWRKKKEIMQELSSLYVNISLLSNITI